MREAAVEARLDAMLMPRLEQLLAGLAAAARDEVLGQGVTAQQVTRTQMRASQIRGHRHRDQRRLRFVDAEMTARFEDGYRQRYSFLMPERALVVEAVSVEAVGAGESNNTFSFNNNR